MVLLLDRVADIDELAVLEDEEVVFLRDLLQALHSIFAEVGDQIDVNLEDSDVWTQLYALSRLTENDQMPLSGYYVVLLQITYHERT